MQNKVLQELHVYLWWKMKWKKYVFITREKAYMKYNNWILLQTNKFSIWANQNGDEYWALCSILQVWYDIKAVCWILKFYLANQLDSGQILTTIGNSIWTLVCGQNTINQINLFPNLAVSVPFTSLLYGWIPFEI